MKRRLLIVTTEYFHPLRFRLHHMLPYLFRNFEIKIVAIVPVFYGMPLENQKQDHVLIIRNPLSGLPIMRVNMLRFFSEIICAVFAAWTMKLKKVYKGFDVCLASQYLGAFSALLTKMPIPIVYEDVDRFEFFARDTFIKKIIRLIERYCIRNSAEVISAGYFLAKSAEEIRGKHVYCIPNGIDFKFFKDIHYDENEEDSFSMVYLGSITPWCGLELAIRALPLIISEFPKTKLIVVGSGYGEKKLQNLAEKLNMRDKVIFLGPRKYHEIPPIISKCAMGLATFPNTELMRFAFTYKVIEYMAAGLPVIATDVGDTGKIIKKCECGVIVESTPKSVAEVVRKLFRNREYALMLSKNGRQCCKDFDLKVLAEREIKVLSQLGRGNRIQISE